MVMKLSRKWKTARPKRRFIKVVKDDSKVVEVIEEGAMDRER